MYLVVTPICSDPFVHKMANTACLHSVNQCVMCFVVLWSCMCRDLSFNNFTGALPSSLGDLSVLTVL
jgi:hypothetical protein